MSLSKDKVVKERKKGRKGKGEQKLAFSRIHRIKWGWMIMTNYYTHIKTPRNSCLGLTTTALKC